MNGNIAVIGAGLVGRAWSISFARAGAQVRLYDSAAGAAEKSRGTALELLDMLAERDLLRGQTPAEVGARIAATDDLAHTLDGAAHVQECVFENVETKRQVFAELDAAAGPGTVIASSTSAILPSAFTEGLPGTHRCLVAHPINPPYLVPAVEVVPSPWTDQASVDRTAALMRDAGHAPIVMRKEVAGFIMNRMQAALILEALRLVRDGYATVEDVDIGLRDGIGLRWAFMGPMETIDLNAPGGIRDYLTRYRGVMESYLESMGPTPDLGDELLDLVEGQRRELLPADKLDERQAWRDERLMDLIAHKARTGL